MARMAGAAIVDVKGDITQLKKDLATAQDITLRQLTYMQQQTDKRMKDLDSTVSKGFTGMSRGVSAFAASVAAAFSFGEIKQALDTGIRAFKGFEDELVKLGNVDVKNIAEIKAQIEALPPELGKAKELTAGYYQIVSSGIRDQEKAAEALEATAMATKSLNDASVTQAEVIKVSTGLMANFPKEINAAKDALDLLFQIENRGKTTTAELVPVLGEVGAIASQIGVKANEMGAAMANVTQISGSTSQAATGVKAVFTALLKPTKDMKEAFELLGVANGKALIEQNGLVKSMEMLDGAAQSMGKQLSDLFGSQEALIGVTGLQIDGYRLLSENVDTMADKTGRLDEAYQRWKKSFDAVNTSFENTKDRLWRDFGESVLPTVTASMQSFIKAVDENKTGIDALFGAFAYGLSAVSGAGEWFADMAKLAGVASTSFENFAGAFQAFSSGNIKGFLGNFEEGMTTLNPLVQKQREEIDKLSDSYQYTVGLVDMFTQAIRREFEAENKDMEKIRELNNSLTDAKKRRDEYGDALEKERASLGKLNNAVKTQHEEIKKVVPAVTDLNIGLGDLTDGGQKVSEQMDKTSDTTKTLTANLKTVKEEVKLTWGEIDNMVASLSEMGKVTGTVTYDIDYGASKTLAEQVAEDNAAFEIELQKQKSMAMQHAEEMVRIGEAFTEMDYDVDFGQMESRADILQREVDEMNKAEEEFVRKQEERYRRMAGTMESVFAEPAKTILTGLRGDWSDLGKVAENALDQLLTRALEVMAEIAAQELAGAATSTIMGWITSHMGTPDTREATYNVKEGQMILPESISEWIRGEIPSLDDIKTSVGNYFGFGKTEQPSRGPGYGDYAPTVGSFYNAYNAWEQGDYLKTGAYAVQGIGQAASTYANNLYSGTDLTTLQTVADVGGALTSVSGAVLSGIAAVEQFEQGNYAGALTNAVQTMENAQNLFGYMSNLFQGTSTAATGTSTAALNAAEASASQTSTAMSGSTSMLGTTAAGAGKGAMLWMAASMLAGDEHMQSKAATIGSTVGGAVGAIAGSYIPVIGTTAGAYIGGMIGGSIGTIYDIEAHPTERFDLDELDPYIRQHRMPSNGMLGFIPGPVGGRETHGDFWPVMGTYYELLNAQAKTVNDFSNWVRETFPGSYGTYSTAFQNSYKPTYSGGGWEYYRVNNVVNGVAAWNWNNVVDALVNGVNSISGAWPNMEDYQSTLRSLESSRAPGSSVMDPYKQDVADTMAAWQASVREEQAREQLLGGGHSGGGVITSGYNVKGYKMPRGDDFLTPVKAGEGVVRESAMEGLNSFLESFGQNGEIISILAQIRDAIKEGKNIIVKIDGGGMAKTADSVYGRNVARGVNDGRPAFYSNY